MQASPPKQIIEKAKTGLQQVENGLTRDEHADTTRKPQAPQETAIQNRSEHCGRLTDVKFKVHSVVFPDVPECKFRADKRLLALRSEIREAMFFGDLIERDVVNITYVHPKGFEIMLSHSSYLDYNTLAGKQDRDAHVPVVLQSWAHSLALQTLSLKNLAQAEEHIFHFVLDNIKHVRENEVAAAVMRWSQEQCAKTLDSNSPLPLEAVMRSLFSKLRFLSMTAEEFLTRPVTWGIVDNDEAMCVLRNIVCKGELPLPTGFCTSTRSRF
ncbi:uncharacterized protein LOC144133917 [Amblyomma americanum]